MPKSQYLSFYVASNEAYAIICKYLKGEILRFILEYLHTYFTGHLTGLKLGSIMLIYGLLELGSRGPECPMSKITMLPSMLALANLQPHARAPCQCFQKSHHREYTKKISFVVLITITLVDTRNSRSAVTFQS